MDKEELKLRRGIIDKCRWMNAEGLNQGTSGNISVRYGDRMLITPSSTPYDAMEPEMIASIDLADDQGTWSGPLRPSVEWPFHQAILRARPEINAIVHTHATFCTVLAMTRRSIPAGHYMVAVFGGSDVRCAPYATYGTQELSDNAIAALEGRTGCLLANHGMITLGSDLDKAMWRAVELEALARQYYHTLLIGGPHILPEDEMNRVIAGFGTYGVQDSKASIASPKKAPKSDGKAGKPKKSKAS